MATVELRTHGTSLQTLGLVPKDYQEFIKQMREIYGRDTEDDDDCGPTMTAAQILAELKEFTNDHTLQ